MFDIAWSEMAIIAAVALVVIGPKDLPRVLRTVGQWTGRARAMAREFQNSLEELARESELEALKKDVEKVVTTDVVAAIDPDGELKQSVEEMHSLTKSEPAPAPPAEALSSPAASTNVANHQSAAPSPDQLTKTGTGASG